MVINTLLYLNYLLDNLPIYFYKIDAPRDRSWFHNTSCDVKDFAGFVFLVTSMDL